MLMLMSIGLSTEQIGVALGISKQTVRVHVQSALARTRTKTRVHMMAVCFRERWVV